MVGARYVDWGLYVRERQDIGIRSGYLATAVIAGELRNLLQDPLLIQNSNFGTVYGGGAASLSVKLEYVRDLPKLAANPALNHQQSEGVWLGVEEVGTRSFKRLLRSSALVCNQC